MTTIQVRNDSDNEPLVLGDGAEFIDGVVLASGQGALTKGAVLGEIGSGATYVPVTIASGATGENFPKLVLAEDTVAASGQTTVSAYTMALLAESKLSFGAGVTLATRVPMSVDESINVSMKDAMRMVGLRTAKHISVSAVENT